QSNFFPQQRSTEQIMLYRQSWLSIATVFIWVMARNSVDGRVLTLSNMLELARHPDLLQVQAIMDELQSFEANPSQMSKRGACAINGGLSHGCDYKDLVGALNEKAYWAGFNPGRKRSEEEAVAPSEIRIPLSKRRSMCRINGGMSHGCDAYDLMGAVNQKALLWWYEPW
ncbi:unnamed protein product, partial [Meganyctiphanes norvegica]